MSPPAAFPFVVDYKAQGLLRFLGDVAMCHSPGQGCVVGSKGKPEGSVDVEVDIWVI